MSQNFLIIGGGQAACSAAAKLRALDQDCTITIISNEEHLPYQRPPLSKKYATGDMQREQLLLRPQEWYDDNKITFINNTKVTVIDRENKQVKTLDDVTYPFDKLLLATGSSARLLPSSAGGNLDGVHVLRGIEDADRISHELVEGRRVLIVGGGYIGLEAAAVAASKGLDVTLIEASQRILQRVACPHTSLWFNQLHSSRGVKLFENLGLERLEEENGKVSAAILSDGSRIEVDFVLVGIGIIPNTELAMAAGLDVESGIVVSANCQTSDSDIYAAGDCALFPYKEQNIRLESVQNAIDQAECAAQNMLDEKQSYLPFPWFWSDQYEIKLQIAGLNTGYDNIIVREGERENSLSHFYFKGDEFLAVDAINDPRTYMVCKKLLEAGKTISPDQAADKELVLKDLL